MDLQSNLLRILTRLINHLQNGDSALISCLSSIRNGKPASFGDSPIAALLPSLHPTHIREYFLAPYIQMSALTLHLNPLLIFDLLTTFDYQTGSLSIAKIFPSHREDVPLTNSPFSMIVTSLPYFEV